MAENNPANELVVHDLTLREQALFEYWTDEAMERAEPIELVLPEGAVQMLLEGDADPAEGELQTNEPTLPGGRAASPGAKWDPQPSCPATGSNTERAPNRSVIPYSAVGKLFMTFGSSNYVGSAWTIGKSGVFTAGHCLFEKQAGGWAKNVLFVPQYHKGAAPHGKWAATALSTLNGWSVDRDFKYDLAAFKVNGDIQSVTGSLGWIANGKPNYDPITGIGYPAGSPFDGQEMWRSTGHYLGGSNPIKAYNNMTGGCSGGPWQTWHNGVPHSTGLNSFRYNSDPATIYSPYFGQGFLNLYNWVK